MTDVPPSRWKVVEQGRRLVVIDTTTGRPATRETVPVRASDPPRPTAGPIEAVTPSGVDDASGAAVFTTAKFYDLKGPRRIVMTRDGTRRGNQRFGWWIIGGVCFVVAAFVVPFLWLVPAFILFHPPLRLLIRQYITARLDESERG